MPTVEKTLTRRYDITGLSQDVCFDDRRTGIITSAVMSLHHYFGDEDYVDYDVKCKGWECKNNGSPDRRGSGVSTIQWHDRVDEVTFHLSLAKLTGDDELVALIEQRIDEVKLLEAERIRRIIEW